MKHVVEASPSHVASAATLSVATMEAFGAMLQNFGLNYKFIDQITSKFHCIFLNESRASPQSNTISLTENRTTLASLRIKEQQDLNGSGLGVGR
ncbi:hypothetical protein L1987_80401 [Smallanthus sonchifolius]|uniref:Uncharacterized protein n=1 Tax=Smallanthus sonchifolius TaxID=185202 RepID=A0ACB8YMH5_9ASTR|nr:hypothetical protein L1987_80401 [Smallanthus sonchifolius]